MFYRPPASAWRCVVCDPYVGKPNKRWEFLTLKTDKPGITDPENYNESRLDSSDKVN